MNQMEVFLICVGLGVLITVSFVLKFVVSRLCHGKCSPCSKEPRTQAAYVISTDMERPEVTSSLVQNGTLTDSSRIRANSYLEYVSLRPRDNQAPHALIRAEPSGPGEAAMFLTFTFSDNESSDHTAEEKHDQPPRYEDLFPISDRHLKTIEEEESMV